MTTPLPEITERVKRATDEARKGAQAVNECWEFFRGNEYCYVTQENLLVRQAVTSGVNGGKPSHRVRLTSGALVDVAERETSIAIQRIPSYEVTPSTRDPEDVNAARLAEKAALYGHGKWGIRDAAEKTIKHALVGDEGFAWPFFDNTVGRPIGDGLCEGEIAVRVFGRNEVSWEPGCRFEESPYHVIEHALPLDRVQADPDVTATGLKPDAAASDAAGPGRSGDGRKLVLITEYLELPTPANPRGTWVTMAAGKPIKPARDYPCWDLGGPVLHKLTYAIDPNSDRDLGLARFLLDHIRLMNDCRNKQAEWKNLALNPQVILQNVEMAQPLTDEPGAVYTAYGSGEIVWRPVPAIPQELEQMRQAAQDSIGRVSGQNDIPTQVEAGKAIQALIERDQQKRAAFIARLAEWHSSVMRHCLHLVQRHYTEPRLLQISGRFGAETIRDFKGADLRGQIDVRVNPASIEPRTRAAIEQRVMTFAQLGWITPESAMSAINGGTAEGLVDDYELDVSWANHCIQLIRDLDQGLIAPEQIPVARPFDNHKVQLHVLKSWMKTQDFARLGPGPQEAANLLIQQHDLLQAQDDQRAAMAQQQMAEGLGMANAARPQAAKPLPSAAGSGVTAPGGTPPAAIPGP